MRITQATIDGAEILLTNMVVIVGSNGTGKTRLLEELNWAFTSRGQYTNFWEIDFEWELNNEDIRQWLESAIYQTDASQKRWYFPFSRTDNNFDGVQLDDEEYQKCLNDESEARKHANKGFLKEFMTYLPINSRLAIPNGAPIVPQNERVTEILNLLFRNPSLVSDINGHLKRFFKKRIEVSPYNIPNLELRIVDNDIDDAPVYDLNNPTSSYQKFTEWLEENRIGFATREGHGVQALLHILLSHCVPMYHVLLVDEPEVHLYPSIKRKFGNTLGEISAKEDKQFICVTHDNDFLQGIIDSKCPSTIIKINKDGKTRKIYHKTLGVGSTYLASQNQTPFLQIPFLDAVIIVEGATDRFCYDYVFYDNGFLSEVEYKFISAGGSDSVVNPERIAHDMNVPCAMILDIENLKEKESKKSLLKLFALEEQKKIHSEIVEIGKQLKGIPDLVIKGVDAIVDPILKRRVTDLITELKDHGVFIIPNGTLESWSTVKIEKTNQFPEKFIEEYQKNKKAFVELRDFLNEVSEYLVDSQSSILY